jgi:hypothetical protein
MMRTFAVLNLLGLISALVGSFFWLYTLTIQPSAFTLVSTGEKTVGICLKGKLVVAGFGGPLVLSDDPCPQDSKTGPIVQVTANRPLMAKWIMPLIALGFGLQLPSAIYAVCKP